MKRALLMALVVASLSVWAAPAHGAGRRSVDVVGFSSSVSFKEWVSSRIFFTETGKVCVENRVTSARYDTYQVELWGAKFGDDPVRKTATGHFAAGGVDTYCWTGVRSSEFLKVKWRTDYDGIVISGPVRVLGYDPR